TLLSRRPGTSVVVVEKEADVARHQTGHNSGVIHSGLYYPPGSLKARLCRQGLRWTREFCDTHGIPHRTTGKLIVATEPEELPRLEALYERGLANRISLRRVPAGELAEREPRVRGLAAVWSPSTGIVDYTRVCRTLATEIAGLGGVVRTSARVTGFDERADAVTVRLAADEPVLARRVVVCAGLQADRLARMAGLGEDFRIVPFRGEYYRLPAARAGLVSTLIYPVPDPSLPFLGVHLTLTVDGGITVGPNAVLGLAREGYPRLSVDLADVADYLAFPGFWRLAARHLSTGLAEQFDSLVKAGYLRRVQRYCPELTADDLLPEPAGIRAQAGTADGAMVDEFLFRGTARMLHVCNAPSPAATAAMPIAAVIADRVSRD
ncbi:MAG: L-2-hydroxyglutarate oxidase, partial [Propionicimonas sp.]